MDYDTLLLKLFRQLYPLQRRIVLDFVERLFAKEQEEASADQDEDSAQSE